MSLNGLTDINQYNLADVTFSVFYPLGYLRPECPHESKGEAMWEDLGLPHRTFPNTTVEMQDM